MSDYNNENSAVKSEVSSEFNLVEEVKIELIDIDHADLTEHAARFEALHGKLQEALNTIDGL
jgi:hypothetical protein